MFKVEFSSIFTRSFLIGVILTLTSMTSTASASQLSDLAANLQEGEWVQIPTNSSLTGLITEDTLTTYSNSAVWDDITGRVLWMGSPGGCCSSNPIYKLLEFDSVANQWDLTPSPFSLNGHAYDGMALDQLNNRFYFKMWYDGVKVWDGSSWSSLPPIPFPENAAPALTWFPEANEGKGALVFVGTVNQLAWFDGTKWIKISHSQSWGTIHTFAEYHPSHGVVWFGAGNGSPKTSFKLESNMTITPLADAPVSLSTGTSGSMQLADAATGKYLVQNHSDGAWWEYDISADSWSRIRNMQNEPSLNGPHSFGVGIPKYGVIMVFENKFSSRVFLYRHGQPKSVPLPPILL